MALRIPNSKVVSPLQVQRHLENFMCVLSTAGIADRGAALVGLVDPEGKFTGRTVEEALAELASGGTGTALVWSLGTPWADVEAALVAQNVPALVLVEGEPDGVTARLMTRSTLNPDGLTDLSRVMFVGLTLGTDTNPPPGAVRVEWDGTTGQEFKLGVGGGLWSQNIMWLYSIGIGAAVTEMDHIDWHLDGGGIEALADTWVVRLGKDSQPSRMTLRNGAQIGGGALSASYMFTINHLAPPLSVNFVLEFTATTGAVIGPNTFYSDVVHTPNPLPPFIPPFFDSPYPVPSTIDASVQYSPDAHSTWSVPSITMLDQAAQVSFDPSVGGDILSSTEVQGALDELTVLATYTAANPVDWGGTPPTSIANALDRLAAMLGPIT